MRLSLVCASALALFVSQANATVVTLDTALHPSGAASSLTISVNLLSLQTITITRGLSGTQPVDFLLDPVNTGTIEAVPLGAIALANATTGFGSPFTALSGTVTTSGVLAGMTLGPESVVNRDFTIDSSSAGSLELYSGTLSLVFTGGFLYGTVTSLAGASSVSIAITTADPIGVSWSALGTNVISGTADRDGSGLDGDGAELNIPSFAISTLFNLAGIDLPTVISGSIFLGSNVFPPAVPEFGSFGLLSLGAAGLCGMIVARRRRRS